MAAFSEPELAYLHGERRLGRLATVGKDGTPHVVPVGWRYNPEHDAIEIGGHDNARTKKYRDVARPLIRIQPDRVVSSGLARE